MHMKPRYLELTIEVGRAGRWMAGQFPRYPFLGDTVIQKLGSHLNSNSVEGNRPSSYKFRSEFNKEFRVNYILSVLCLVKYQPGKVQ